VETERWKRIEAIYHQAADTPAPERAQLLDRECADDSDLRREVEALLKSGSESTILRSPAFEQAARDRVRGGSRVTEGQQLGGYTVVGLLGKGGMGEVYRARDTKLGRDVALKILPPSLAFDPDRIRRFDREARLLAALNHPGIATIHGLEETNGQKLLILELVEGQTLAERLQRGAIPVGEALLLVLQIAEALEAAHESGIIHRDLKPANVKIRPDGRVKVLDFGLAKELVAGNRHSDASDLPTDSLAATAPGTLLGTSAYMSPEQARGHEVDKRTDIWSLGCLLYEMLTGYRPFVGDSVAETLSSVLEREPDWSALPQTVPPSIKRLVRLCLKKDRARRRQSAADVRVDIEQALNEPVEAVAVAPPTRRRPPARLVWTAAGVLLAVLAVRAIDHLREVPPAEMRLDIMTPATPRPLHFALSPDGTHIAFVASGPSGNVLYLRSLNDAETQPVAGTEGAQYPFWSPNSRSIGFFASGMLLRVDLEGGPPIPLAPAPAPQGGAWSPEGTILFAPNTVSPLMRVSASGGDSVAVTDLRSPRHKNHRLPFFLADGRHFLFYAEAAAATAGIYIGSLDGEPPKRLAPAASAAVPFPPDHVAFVQGGRLIAQRLDTALWELTGDPVILAPSTGVDPLGQVGFSASQTGILAYRIGSGPVGQMTWFDRDGNVLALGGDLNGPDLSNSERYVAYDRTTDANRDVWIMDLVRGGTMPFTTHPDVDGYPLWSPDDLDLVFESNRNGTFDLWIAPVSRAEPERLLLGSTANEIPVDWSMDGQFLLYRSSDENYRSSNLWALPMREGPGTPAPVATSDSEERMGEFSPDGRWVVYETDKSGRFEIVVQAFPEARGQWPVSTNGGFAPRWSRSGDEIYFVSPDGMMMAVRVSTTNATFEADIPMALFPTRLALHAFNFQYTVSRDGRFLVNNVELDHRVSPITLILNWRP
jgi:eukaryotic-like serine/threonine-protein kinase